MMTREESELLIHIGPGTAMGELLREYWTPALRAARLEADGAPVRVRLLGENFVAFRATDGRVGFFDEGCPHRCTSLALARNEDNALTCIFHGWKIDVSGKVVDVPSEPPERRAEFAAKVRARHYPAREAGGIVWVYLGKHEQPPKFFDFEFTYLPERWVNPNVAIMHCNWLQGFEALLDSAHVGILHSAWLKGDQSGRPGDRRRIGVSYATVNTGPVFEFVPQPYGFREGALRDLFDGTVYARIREVMLPYYSFIPGDVKSWCVVVCAVPIDDEWTSQWYISYDPHMREDFRQGPIPGSSGDPDNFCSDMGGPENMWHQDRKKMKEGHWTGIDRCIPYEDFIVEEAMGPIVDRSREYLGMCDAVLIRGRRMLLKAVRDHMQGKPPFGMEQEVDYRRIRALAIRYPKEKNWREFDAMNPPESLS